MKLIDLDNDTMREMFLSLQNQITFLYKSFFTDYDVDVVADLDNFKIALFSNSQTVLELSDSVVFNDYQLSCYMDFLNIVSSIDDWSVDNIDYKIMTILNCVISFYSAFDCQFLDNNQSIFLEALASVIPKNEQKLFL